MLEKAEPEETSLFCHVIIISSFSIGGAPPPPLATPMFLALLRPFFAVEFDRLLKKSLT